MTEKIELWAGEHHVLSGNQEKLDKRITDSMIHIGDNLYHLECQSNPDGSMVLRMVEYDFHIALENAIEVEKGYEMRFPESAVLYLRHNEDTPDEIQMTVIFPQDQSVTYRVPVVKTQQYSDEDIVGKQLYFLIPYYILRYEHVGGEECMSEITREYQNLYEGMIDAREAGMLNEYDMSNILDFARRLVEYVFDGNQKMKSEVSAVMGGEVLETYADRMIAKGIEKGMEKGMEKGSMQMMIKLSREFGVPEEKLVERLMEEFAMDREEAEKACAEI